MVQSNFDLHITFDLLLYRISGRCTLSGNLKTRTCTPPPQGLQQVAAGDKIHIASTARKVAANFGDNIPFYDIIAEQTMSQVGKVVLINTKLNFKKCIFLQSRYL